EITQRISTASGSERGLRPIARFGRLRSLPLAVLIQCHPSENRCSGRNDDQRRLYFSRIAHTCDTIQPLGHDQTDRVLVTQDQASSSHPIIISWSSAGDSSSQSASRRESG